MKQSNNLPAVLLHPTYCPDIITFGFIVQRRVVWEVEDNFQKQTYRNRCFICTDQGKHMMNIPIRHVGGDSGRQKYREVRLDNSYSWQRQHWKTLQTSYRASPFFEYYEDDLIPLYTRSYKFLLDFNLEGIAILCHCLQTPVPEARTLTYMKSPKGISDGRYLVNAKAAPPSITLKYHQVFEDRHGFIPNMSVLDLLFNLGPTSLMALQELDL